MSDADRRGEGRGAVRRRPPGPTRREVVRGVAGELERAGLESPRVEAERLVANALGVARAELTVAGGVGLTPSEAAAVARVVARRLEGEPLQHIEGTAEFRTLTLVSDGRALVPRPETEQLLDLVEAWLVDRTPAARALDVGVGSGALALSLLAEGLAGRVVGLDVSARALAQAAENAARLGVDGLELRACGPDIWSGLEPGERFDLIVSNPPYVATSEWAGLEPGVRDREPRVALDGGEDGLDVFRVLAAGLSQRLAPGGAVFLEIGHDQAEAVTELLRAAGLAEVRVARDLAGRTRFVMATRSASGTRDA